VKLNESIAIPFTWNESSSLALELAKPIKWARIYFYPLDFPNAVTLLRPDGTALEIRSAMHDITERVEVGVLTFNPTSIAEGTGTIIELPRSFADGITVSKLTIHEGEVSAESGIILKANNNEELVVVAGAYPYSLAISGAVTLLRKFDPEYPMDAYDREIMQNF
jgi:hypothetical protein